MADFKYDSFVKWKMAITDSWMSPKSSDLKKLESAMEDWFNNKNLETKGKIRSAFMQWTSAKPSWKNGTRDKTGAMSAIDDFVNTVIHVAAALTELEKKAAQAIDEANQNALAVLFGEVKFQMKTTAVASLLYRLKNLKTKADIIKKLRSAPAEPPSYCADILNAVIGKSLLAQFSEILKNTLPFINIVVSSANLADALLTVVLTNSTKNHIVNNEFAIAPGDPVKALEAVQKLLERKARQAQVGAASAAVGLSGALVSAFTVGTAGLVVGFAKSTFDMLEAYHIAGQEAEEFKAGIEAIKNQTLDFTIFEKCPLLGAYFIACSDTSAIINMAVAKYGQLNWQYDVEILVKRMDKLLDASRELIRTSNFELLNLAQNKGRVVNSKYTFLKMPIGLFHKFQVEIDGVLREREYQGNINWLSPEEAVIKADLIHKGRLGSGPTLRHQL